MACLYLTQLPYQHLPADRPDGAIDAPLIHGFVAQWASGDLLVIDRGGDYLFASVQVQAGTPITDFRGNPLTRAALDPGAIVRVQRVGIKATRIQVLAYSVLPPRPPRNQITGY